MSDCVLGFDTIEYSLEMKGDTGGGLAAEEDGEKGGEVEDTGGEPRSPWAGEEKKEGVEVVEVEGGGDGGSCCLRFALDDVMEASGWSGGVWWWR